MANRGTIKLLTILLIYKYFLLACSKLTQSNLTLLLFLKILTNNIRYVINMKQSSLLLVIVHSKTVTFMSSSTFVFCKR